MNFVISAAKMHHCTRDTFYQDTNIDITTGYHGTMVL